MKTETKASPRPWALHPDGSVSDSSGDWVGGFHLAKDADEQFAFRAVNSFDALVEALEKIAREKQSFFETPTIAATIAEAALKLAKGEQ